MTSFFESEVDFFIPLWYPFGRAEQITFARFVGGDSLSRKYSFVFPGTKEMFFAQLQHDPQDDAETFHFGENLVKIAGNQCNFSVQPCGYAGAYWFQATVAETENQLWFHGKIAYRHSSHNRWYHKVADCLEAVCLMMFFLPVILIFKIYTWIRLLILKIQKQPIEKEKNAKDQLFDLMEKRLHCTRIQKGANSKTA